MFDEDDDDDSQLSVNNRTFLFGFGAPEPRNRLLFPIFSHPRGYINVYIHYS